MDVILLGTGSPLPAQTAQRAGVSTLMLTHYAPHLASGQEEEWRAIARPHFCRRDRAGRRPDERLAFGQGVSIGLAWEERG